MADDDKTPDPTPARILPKEGADGSIVSASDPVHDASGPDGSTSTGGPIAETESSEAPDTGRHRGREVALQVLYAIDLAGTDAAASPVPEDEFFDRIASHFEVPRGVEKFARALVTDVTRRLASLDEILGAHARNWRVSRMAAVDRNVLRLAIFELRDSDVPVAVVIDEAVDLAKRFGSDSSPSFVNGVLDAVARAVRAP